MCYWDLINCDHWIYRYHIKIITVNPFITTLKDPVSTLIDAQKNPYFIFAWLPKLKALLLCQLLKSWASRRWFKYEQTSHLHLRPLGSADFGHDVGMRFQNYPCWLVDLVCTDTERHDVIFIFSGAPLGMLIWMHFIEFRHHLEHTLLAG